MIQKSSGIGISDKDLLLFTVQKEFVIFRFRTRLHPCKGVGVIF